MPFPFSPAIGLEVAAPVTTISKDLETHVVRLPEDELAHPGTMEWWYFKAHLLVGETRRISMFAAVLKQDIFRLPASVALLRVTDHHTGPQSLLATARPFDAKVYRPKSDHTFELDYTFGGGVSAPSRLVIASARRFGVASYRLAASGQHTFELDLRTDARHVVLGQGGIVDYAGGARLAYWARPTLEVTGTFEVDGAARPVTGVAWMERQWGHASIADYAWSYFPVQLDDGDRYLFYRTRHRASSATSQHGVHIDRDGLATVVGDITFTPGDRYLETNKRVAIDWTIKWHRPTPRVLVIKPIFNNQVISVGLPKVPDFYEGISAVFDAAGERIGWSMTELHNH